MGYRGEVKARFCIALDLANPFIGVELEQPKFLNLANASGEGCLISASICSSLVMRRSNGPPEIHIAAPDSTMRIDTLMQKLRLRSR